MKTSQRHHLKDNELALMLGRASDYVNRHQRTLVLALMAIAVAIAAIGGYMVWQNRVEERAREMLARAMVVSESRVMPATPPLADGEVTAQQPGTFPTEQAKLEVAVPAFLAAADAYPSTDAGRTARYHAAAALVALGRFDEAIAQYEQVSGGGGLLGQMSRLGQAEAQLRALQFEPAIDTFRTLAEDTRANLPREALLLELARAYRLSGNVEDARKTLTEIVDQHADSPFAADARQELEKLQG